MPILPVLVSQFRRLFPATDHRQGRGRWFVLKLEAALVPITALRTSNLLRTITNLFGVDIAQSRDLSFMTSVKLCREALWALLWRAMPDPLTDGRLLYALDDSINPKTGAMIFACEAHLRPCRQMFTNETQRAHVLTSHRWASSGPVSPRRSPAVPRNRVQFQRGLSLPAIHRSEAQCAQLLAWR